MVGVYFVDCGNAHAQNRYEDLQRRGIIAEHLVITGDYLDLFRSLTKITRYEYAWILSSLCDYSNFDFNWRPKTHRQSLLHVFPSNNQLSGDTFFINFNTFRKKSNTLESLDWYDQIYYCRDQSAQRPIKVSVSSLVTKRDHYFLDPSILLADINGFPEHTPKLWSFNRKIEKLPVGGNNDPLDIVHISNGEPDSERWYQNLSEQSKNYPNRLFRITGINDRTSALREAARQSQTPWFFAVPAKIEIHPGFDWFWTPPLSFRTSHYIFYSQNPINGLEYGHMAMVAYNRNLALKNESPGLDFTMSQPTRTIPKVVGTAHYNATPAMAWRTAFREVIKLRHDYDHTGNIETGYRLRQWAGGYGPNAEWSMTGANDANEYYESVDGDLAQLMPSYHWSWLNSRFESKYTSA